MGTVQCFRGTSFTHLCRSTLAPESSAGVDTRPPTHLLHTFPLSFAVAVTRINRVHTQPNTEVGRFHAFLYATKALRESRVIALLCF